MNEICKYCGEDTSGELVTAGRDNKGESLYSCPWCWEVRHPPRMLLNAQDLCCGYPDEMYEAVAAACNDDQIHRILVHINESRLEFYARKLGSYRQQAIDIATGKWK